jgi:GDSL-like lipase/acylhydrolase family protein
MNINSSKRSLPIKRAQNLPKVLIIGDSISMGYTPVLKNILKARARVTHPKNNCQHTQKGIMKLDEWIGERKYKVIYFNFGLHDLKHVDPVTQKPSKKAEDPLMTDLKDYEANLNQIVSKLKATGATLIFATTTPVPEKSTPLRDPEMPPKYNAVAVNVMKKQKVEVDDLYAFVFPQNEKIQEANNVHYTVAGYQIIGERVAATISNHIP